MGSAAESLAKVNPDLGGQLGQLAQAVGAPLQSVQQSSGNSVKSIDSVQLGISVGLSIVNVAGWFNLRMADEAVEITKLGVENGRQQILAGVAQAYLAALLCGEVVKIQRVQLKSALDQLSLAQGRYDRGADVKLSVIQAQFGVENNDKHSSTPSGLTKRRATPSPISSPTTGYLSHNPHISKAQTSIATKNSSAKPSKTTEHSKSIA